MKYLECPSVAEVKSCAIPRKWVRTGTNEHARTACHDVGRKKPDLKEECSLHDTLHTNPETCKRRRGSCKSRVGLVLVGRRGRRGDGHSLGASYFILRQFPPVQHLQICTKVKYVPNMYSLSISMYFKKWTCIYKFILKLFIHLFFLL